MCCKCAPETRQSVIYLIKCDFDSGQAWVERAAERTGRDNTIEDIRSGEVSNVLQVLEIEFEVLPISTRDVTKAIMADVFNEFHEPPSAVERLAWERDHARDTLKNA